MKDTNSKFNSKAGKLVRKILCYSALFAVILTFLITGSRKDQVGPTSSPIITAINDSSFVVTTDQLSESYIVAGMANTLSLPSVASVNENFTSIVMNYTMAGTTDSGTIEKPNIVDTSDLARGIKTYTVLDGDTLDKIAKQFGVTTTQIRWSNNMKTDTLSPGQRLYIPSVPGILYTVKSGDTLEGLAEKYKSDAAQIVAYNDLETSGLVVGKTIILPDGELPEKERPEYVAPVSRPRPIYSSSAVRDSGTRQGMREIGSYSYWSSVYYSTRGEGNPGAFGNCTWFAWYWRRHNMPSSYWLPSGVIGNAGTWTYMSWSSNFIKNKTPARGAVVQTSTGSPGHVGVVTGVVSGQYITIQEMNYGGYNGKFNHVYESRIDWSNAIRYNYIHGRK